MREPEVLGQPGRQPRPRPPAGRRPRALEVGGRGARELARLGQARILAVTGEVDLHERDGGTDRGLAQDRCRDGLATDAAAGDRRRLGGQPRRLRRDPGDLQRRPGGLGQRLAHPPAVPGLVAPGEDVEHAGVGGDVEVGESERACPQRRRPRAAGSDRLRLGGLPAQLDRRDHLDECRGHRARPGRRGSCPGGGIVGRQALDEVGERRPCQPVAAHATLSHPARLSRSSRQAGQPSRCAPMPGTSRSASSPASSGST